MCGRTCLTLEPNEVLKACKYKIKAKNNVDADKTTAVEYLDNGVVEPEWRCEFNCGRNYTPSFNLAPTDITPVLVSNDHFADDVDFKLRSNDRIVVPMMWGMIPFWHEGDYRKHRLTTNNCRLEGMQESKMYRRAFKKGQRCVILCEGFYEWQTTNNAKSSERAAYLLYMPQNDSVKIYDRNTWNTQDINLLKMAGLFDIWEDQHGDKIYSYSIITFDSTSVMSWLHYRMPAILESEQQINNWLDFKNVLDEEALSALYPPTKLYWHQVSNLVNNSRNKSDQCNKPIEMEQPKQIQMNKIMAQWLSGGKRKKEKSNDEGNQSRELTHDAQTTNELESPVIKRPRF